jgi:carboxyl-terminal processing protease
MEPEVPEPSRLPRRSPDSAGGWNTGLILLAGFLLGWLSSSGCAAHKSGLDTRLLNEAWNTIEQNYVQRSAIETQALTYGAINGMVNALGDTGHSTFLTPAMVKVMNQAQSGQLKGIGAEIEVKDRRVVVVAPIDGSPAQRAGLHPGDIILKVSGQAVTGMPIGKVVEKVSGKPGTSVHLTIQEPKSGHIRELTLVRAKIKLHDVTWQELPGTRIVHLRIARFDNGATEDARQALRAILQHHPEGIILDLRNNPGGLLDEAVGLASQFLISGNVLEAKNGKGLIEQIPVEKGGLAPRIPLVVLINEGSASAAEIVAGALKSDGRAQLVGETTFGTGTVLREFKLSDGSALLLAIEEWLTPDGQSFWHKGVTPDVTVSLPEDQSPLLPEAERDMTPAQLEASGDAQLLRAVEILKRREQQPPPSASAEVEH